MKKLPADLSVSGDVLSGFMAFGSHSGRMFAPALGKKGRPICAETRLLRKSGHRRNGPAVSVVDPEGQDPTTFGL